MIGRQRRSSSIPSLIQEFRDTEAPNAGKSDSGKGRIMAISATDALPISTAAESAFALRSRRRHVSPQAARAQRLLGRAIEYLANEFLNDIVPPSAQNGRFQAVQMLMALSRKVYSECPEASQSSSFRERCRLVLTSCRH
jgi:hypothetical protein